MPGLTLLRRSDIVPCAAIAAFILITMAATSMLVRRGSRCAFCIMLQGLGTSHTINEIFENIRSLEANLRTREHSAAGAHPTREASTDAPSTVKHDMLEAESAPCADWSCYCNSVGCVSMV